MHFADFVDFTGVIQDPLGRRGLTRINMRHDAEVAIVFNCVFACHASCLSEESDVVTSDNGRMRGWLRPSCVCLHVS